ncbi:MAG: hypothetical protein WA924_15375 [Burkholderiaceae bacterium]
MTLRLRDKAWYFLCRLHNRSTGRFIFHCNIYGVRLFGVQITPVSTMRLLMDGSFLTARQRQHYRVFRLF